MREWVDHRFDLYSRTLLLAAFVLTPVFFLKSTLGVLDIAKGTVLWALLVSALALWAVRKLLTRQSTPLSRIAIYGAGFVAISALATSFSPFRLAALIGHYGVYAGLISLELNLIALVLIIALWSRRPEKLREICMACGISALMVAGYQFLQEAGLDWNVWRLNGRIAPWEPGSLGNPNFTGGYLGITIPFILYLALTAQTKAAKYFFGASCLLQFTALWLTSSRGGFLAALTGVSFFVVAYRQSIPSLLKRGVALGLAILALLAIFALARAPQASNSQAGPQVFGMSLNPKSLVETRADYWITAIRIIAERPILGTGPDTYYAKYPRLRPAENGADPNLTLENNPHNIFLAHAVGSGLLGLAAYILMVGTALVYAFRTLKTLQGTQRLLLVTFTSALIGYLTQGLVSIDHVPLALIGWTTLGAIAVIADPLLIKERKNLDSQAKPAAAPSRRSAGRTTLLIGLVTLILLTFPARALIADTKALDSFLNPDPGAKGLLLDQAMKLNPAEAQYRFMAGTFYQSQALNGQFDRQTTNGLYKQAEIYYLQSLARKRNHVDVMATIAQLNAQWGFAIDRQRFIPAGQWWRRVIAADPNNYRWHLQYSAMLGASASKDNNNRQLRLAQIDEARKSIAIYREQPLAWRSLEEAYRAIGDNAQAQAVATEYFGSQPSGAAASPAAPGAAPATEAPPESNSQYKESGFAPTVGLLLGLGLPALAGAAWFQATMLRTRRQRKALQADQWTHELIAAAGIWSMAVAVRFSGPLIGLTALQGEIRELLLHLIPGAVALVLGVAGSMRPYQAHAGSASFQRAAPLVALTTAVAASLVHLSDLFVAERPADLATALVHSAPLLTIAILVTISNSQQAGDSPG